MPEQMTYAAHARAILVLGLPLIGSHIAQMAIGMTDTMMMGWYGVDELAALVLASSLFFILFLVGAGFAIAVMPMVASAAGAGDEVRVRRVTRMGLWLSTLFTLAALPVFIWSRELLVFMGQDPAIAELAQEYLHIIVIALMPALFVMVIKGYLSAQERTTAVFLITVLGTLANIVLNYALIFGHWGAPEMGVRGAATASVIVQTASFPLLAGYAAWRLPQHDLFRRLWRPDFEVLREVFHLGVPIGLTNFAEVGLFSVSAVMIGWIGTPELAAHGIALQWASLLFMVHLGLSNAATVRAGRAVGRGDAAGLRRGGASATVLSMTVAAAVIVLFLSVPEPLIRLFLDNTDPEAGRIVAIGASLLAMAALFQVADGAQVIAVGLLRGVQDARVPFVLATISYWGIGLPVSYGLAFWAGFGPVGVWSGLVLGLTLAAVLLSWRFWSREWVG